MDIDAETDTLDLHFRHVAPDVRGELESMLRIYHLSPQELFYKWESYSIRMGCDLNYTNARNLKKDIQDQLDRETREKVHMRHPPSAKTPRTVKMLDVNADFMGDLIPTTPKNRTTIGGPTPKRRVENTPLGKTPQHLQSSPAGAAFPQTPTPHTGATPFSQRTTPGAVVEVLNPHISEQGPIAAGTKWEDRVKLAAYTEIKKFSYRPMFQKLLEASEVFDDKIEEFAQLIQEHHNITEFGNPAVVDQEEVVVVGRITSDDLDGKLNHQSILLESSRRMGGGARIPLKLDKVSSYSVFPGQIVAIKGTNAGGEYFAVREFLELPRLPAAASTPAELQANAAKLESDGPLSLFVTTGPYTTDDNLYFEALEEIIERAEESRPDVLLMIGPFVDIEHPLISTGDFDLEDPEEEPTLEGLFREKVSKQLKRLQHTLIILIPSPRDAISKHVSFPQEAFSRKGLDLPKNVKLLPSPATITLNEVIFTLTAPDIIFHMGRFEVNKNPSNTNGPHRVVSHLISQRSVYPLFPPPASGTIPKQSQPCPLDVPFVRLADLPNVAPDVLIVPSMMVSFVKVVDGVVAINPGALSKGKGAGTWVRMWITPARVGTEEGQIPHRIHERVRAEVVRI
ncbi:DNA polymerase alpha/primase associated subunit [Ascobolus immersus RN42]|uniref:DNA polymerase alpha subunit B n=1 Tax=Ascobolus immersus RN42 TaxID=1160509 RepID=A0A3N4HZR7_ASCIM|nr:DNA polymerase alpha/primase associated subunit [Ascobolus immersus RN42]